MANIKHISETHKKNLPHLYVLIDEETIACSNDVMATRAWSDWRSTLDCRMAIPILYKDGRSCDWHQAYRHQDV